MKKNILDNLKIKDHNSGASYGESGWAPTTNHKPISSINPTTEEVIATVRESGHRDYETVMAKAEENFQSWRMLPAPKRGEIVRQIAILLREKKELLGTLITLEMGKPLQESLGEVQEMIDMADFAVGLSRMLYGNTMQSERPQHRMFEQWHPLGVIGVISSFNFPMAVWSWNAFIAAVCGDTVVWKPSSKTPLCAIAIQHICNQVMQENGLEGIFNLFICEDPDILENFVKDNRFPLISFTGSTSVGTRVNRMVSKRLGGCLLECSGNNALIIDESADLSLAIPATVFGAVGTTGQRCTSTRRLFVPESMYDDIVERIISAYKQVSIGDPLDSKNLMGPLVDQTSVAKFLQAIETAKSSGGKILFGGKKLEETGYFVQPTIIEGLNQWPIVQKETFGPILYVMSYRKFDEAIKMNNNVTQGLSSALFTNNIKHAEKFISAMGSDCGIANINIGTSGAEIGGAFGGEKATGGGREAGSDAWKSYMRRQTNTINWSDELPLAQGIKFNLE